MKQIGESVQEFLGPLPMAQRVLMGGISLLVLVMIGTLFYWVLKPDYALLYGSVEPDVAHRMVQTLEEQGVAYRLENGGRSIHVQSSQVHEMRLLMASEGFGEADVRGYELFDENALGMTDFMQQVNNKRAMEGELSRSINTLEQVESSRVHLVLPERRPFREASVEASASVLLKLRRGRTLRPQQVEGIASLVSGSVEGLEVDQITVLDQNGNRLTDELESHTEIASGSMQMKARRQTEDYLREQGQSMLDRVLGPGNSVLRVSVEHDFDRTVRESELIDPESRVVISEERHADTRNQEQREQVPFDDFTPLADRGQTVITGNDDSEVLSDVRNYDVSRTREVVEQAQGEIKHLNASVLLNFKQTPQTGPNGETTWVDEPYSDQELRELHEIVRLALGIQAVRGDELAMTQIQFFDPQMDSSPWTPGAYFPPQETMRWVLILFTFGILLWLVRSFRNRFDQNPGALVPASLRESEEVEHVDWVEEDKPVTREIDMDEFVSNKLSLRARKQLELNDQVLDEIKEFAEGKPAEAAQVVRALMASDKG
ncbi:MAG: flagellar basal-body MS-ring/collar protein FliF [Balneolaceae bacterium]